MTRSGGFISGPTSDWTKIGVGIASADAAAVLLAIHDASGRTTPS
jgi:hypothetical protein